MFKRIKNIIISPKSEWGVIEGENTPHVKLLTKYVLPLSLITIVSAFVGYMFTYLLANSYMSFGHVVGNAMSWGFRQAMTNWAIVVGGIYAMAVVIHIFAKFFGAEKDFDKSYSLAAHAFTPALLGGVFFILPWGLFSSLMLLAPIVYSFFLLYFGMQPMKKAPAEKNIGYFLASAGAMIVAATTFWLIGSIITLIWYRFSYFGL